MYKSKISNKTVPQFNTALQLATVNVTYKCIVAK